MTSNIANLNTLLGNAQDSGRISNISAQILKAPAVFQGLGVTFGMSGALHDTADVTGISMIVDDSTSIRMRGNTQNVRDAVNYYLQETRKATNSDEFIMSILQLNKPPICEFLPLANVPKLDNQYNPSGFTPLYDRAVDGLGSLILRREEALTNGQYFRGVLVLVTDGKDEGSTSGALERFKQLATDVVSKERSPIIVILIGISDGSTDFRAVGQKMGISSANIFEASSGGHELRQIMGVVSQISKRVSRVAPGAVSALNLGAFGNV